MKACGIGVDGLTSQQRSAAKVGEDGLTNQQRNRAKIGADGLTNRQRNDAKIYGDGLTKSQRRDAKIGVDGLTYRQRNDAKIGADGLTNRQRRVANDPEYVRKVQLKTKYGLTISDFNALLAAQGGACAICRDADKKWCVDHDHVSGKVRAILCNGCNVAIGHLKDSSKVAYAATNYLLKHGK